MRQTLHCFSRAILLLTFIGVASFAEAQILIQDFGTLTNINQFASTNPTAGQVNAIDDVSNDGSTTLELQSSQGRQFLQLNKGSNSTVSFIKNEDFNNPQVLLLQFELDAFKPDSIADGDNNGLIADFYIGDDLTPFLPARSERFAVLGISVNGRDAEGNTQFSVRVSTSNESGTTVQGETGNITNPSFIAAYLNTTDATFSYLGPDGNERQVNANSVDVWVDEDLVINNAIAQNGADAPEITSVKFQSRNNGSAIGALNIDNILIDAVTEYQEPQSLTTAGGTFTVGVGGDYTNFTRPNGVFAALNALDGAITQPFIFNVISDILNETGEVALNELAGTSQANYILIQPATASRTYTISGNVSVAEENSLFFFNGIDYLRIDGRGVGATGTGLSATKRLTIRNSSTAPTILFGNTSTNNYIGYSAVQGGSEQVNQGVIDINGEGGGNSFNTIEYNRLGGYANVFPLNVLTSFSNSEIPNSNMTIVGNEFYDFGAKGSSSANSPSEILIDEGSTDWTITDNHFYQEGKPGLASGTYTFRAIRIKDGSNYLIERNYFGGSTTFAEGDRLIVNSPNGQGNYSAILPLSYASPTQVSSGYDAQFTNNVVRNIQVDGFPNGSGALAFGLKITGGYVNVAENIFNDVLASSNGSTARSSSSYLVSPIRFEYDNKVVGGNISNNRIYDINLEGEVTSAGVGSSSIDFVGIYVGANVEVPTVSNNQISNINSNVTERLNSDLKAIVYGGTATPISITNNTICDFNNNLTIPLGIDFSDVNSITGIYLDINQTVANELQNNDITQVLVANNIISFSTDEPTSTTSINGIYSVSQTNRITKILYNTIYFTGGDNQNNRTNSSLRRDDNSPMEIFNNIFLNTRESSDPGFLYYFSDINDLESDYNYFYKKNVNADGFSGYAYLESTGELALDLEGWYLLTEQINGLEDTEDINSLEGSPARNNPDGTAGVGNIEGDFINAAACNLRIVQNALPSPIIDAGIVLNELDTDIDGNIRVIPDIGASEAYNTWIGQDSVDPTDWNRNANWSTGTFPNCESNNYLAIVPIGTIFNSAQLSGTVTTQPVVDIPNAVYKTIQILNEASITIGTNDAVLQQCELVSQNEANLLGINNRGTVNYNAAGTIGLRGVLQNIDTWSNDQGTFLLNGQFAQNIISEDTLTVSELRINGAGNKNLLTDLMVSDSLEFVNGIVLSTLDNILIAGPKAMTASANNTSYINGPMLKMFDATSTGISDEFVAPTGDAGQLGRASLAVCDDEAVTYQVQYFYQSPEEGGYPLDAAFYQEPIEEVTDREYWEMARIEGNTDATVTLYYDNASGLSSPQDIVVAQWVNESATTGTPLWTNASSNTDNTVLAANAPDLGRITSDNCIMLASEALALTFANTNPEAPLPVELDVFTARLNGQNVQVRWETASEINSSLFVVMRSVDGTNYENIGEVTAKGNSSVRNKYVFNDELVAKKYAGIVYYKLKQVDFDGASEMFGPVSVTLPDPDFTVSGVYPNPFENNLVINVVGSRDQEISLKLTDVEGRVVHSQTEFMRVGENISPAINGARFSPGVYILEVSTADMTRQIKVVKK